LLALVGFALFAFSASAHATFPGKNGKIAHNGIFTLNPDGSGRTLFTSGHAPEWSADGRKLVFHEFEGPPAEADIEVINADGTGLTNLTPFSGFENRYPAWSPDGSKIVFHRFDGTGGGLYLMNADGTGITRLTNADSGSDPDWSPDGKKIAFQKGSPVPDGIYTINPDDSGLVKLTSGDDSLAEWSPDGQQIVFIRFFPEDSDWSPVVMNSDGTAVHRLPGFAGSAAWSPDGSKIVINNGANSSTR
jgi:Tol biopolymer transport system component